MNILKKIAKKFGKKIEEQELQQPIPIDLSYITEEYLDNYYRNFHFLKEDGEWENENFIGKAYRKYDTSVVFDESDAVTELLDASILFAMPTDDFEENRDYGIRLELNANDFFYWGCADSEPLPFRFIRFVYDTYKSNGYDGRDILLCYLRKQQPQQPIKDMMIAEGSWQAWLEKYPIYES